MKTLLATLLFALLAGCATPHIDKTYSAKGQSSRVKFVVLHYTVANTPLSLKILTEQVVSSHYLVTDEANPVIYGLVDESRQSNHAGVSNWKNHTLLNGSSIGIEIVNPGFTETPTGRVWYPFPQAQVDKVIGLVKEIMERHNIPKENVLGHADIAPQRKQDPGPMFPWYQLAQHGLIAWPDAARLANARLMHEQQLPDVAWFQKQLAVFGYAVPQTGVLDDATRKVIGAFQMRYRPATIDGTPDAETAALLDALTVPADVKPVEVKPVEVQPVEAAPVPDKLGT
jgi:N-acetylmuramoyl-L-alanine amidase